MSNVSQDSAPSAADIVQRVVSDCEDLKPKAPNPYLTPPGFNLNRELLKWRVNMFKTAMGDKYYADVIRPIRKAFNRSCMRHSMQCMDNEAMIPGCPVEYNVELHKLYRRRLDARVTQAAFWESDWTEDEIKFDLDKKLTAAIEPLRTQVLKGVAVELLAALPSVGKMKQKDVIQVIKHLVDTMNLTFHCHGMGGQKWPTDLWAPVLIAVLHCRNLSFPFANEPKATEEKEQCGTFIKRLLTEIVRVDNVNELKVWISRCTSAFFDDEHMAMAIELPLHLAIKYNAKKCYTFMCEMHTNRCASRKITLKGPCIIYQMLTDITLKYLRGTEMTMRWHQSNARHLPPLLPSMLRLMWGKCGFKPAVTELPRQPHGGTYADFRRVLKSRARDYHWELVRRGVWMHFFRHWLQETAQKKRYAGVLVDGQALITGDIAAADLDAVAKSRGLAVYEREDTGGDTEMAIAQARNAQFRYRVQEARLAAHAGSSSRWRASDSDDNDDDVSHVAQKTRRESSAPAGLTEEEKKTLFELGRFGHKSSQRSWEKAVDKIKNARSGAFPHDWYAQVNLGELYRAGAVAKKALCE